MNNRMLVHNARKKDSRKKENTMKKTIVLLLSLATVIGCMSLPAAAYSKKVWKSTAYYNSYMADTAHVKFTTTKFELISFTIGLKGKDGKIRGDKSETWLIKGTGTKDSSPVDTAFNNSTYCSVY